MSKTFEEYLEANGWSSHHFLEHAKILWPWFKKVGIEVKIGRSVVHLSRNGKKGRLYVHYKGRPNTTLTFITDEGVTDFVHTCKTDDIKKIINPNL